MEYLAIELVCATVTVCVHLLLRLRLFEKAKHALLFWVPTISLGTLWDWIAIERGHWSYSQDALVGLSIGIIPIEDLIFFVLVPYVILVIYAIPRHFSRRRAAREGRSL